MRARRQIKACIERERKWNSRRYVRLCEGYIRAQRAVKHACRKARRAYYDDKLANVEAMFKSDPKRAWQEVKQLAGQKKVNGDLRATSYRCV